MAWSEDNPPTRQPRQIGVGLPGAAVLDAAGYPLSFWAKLRLGLGKFLGEIEPVDDALPSQVHGVATQGRQRMTELIDLIKPFASRANFGSNPNDAYEMLDALEKKAVGVDETGRAAGLLKVYRAAVAKRNLRDELGLPPPQDDGEVPGQYLPSKGLSNFQRRYRQSE